MVADELYTICDWAAPVHCVSARRCYKEIALNRNLLLLLLLSSLLPSFFKSLTFYYAVPDRAIYNNRAPL